MRISALIFVSMVRWLGQELELSRVLICGSREEQWTFAARDEMSRRQLLL